MKHLITLTACLLVLMALLSQFVHNQNLLMQLEQGSRIVDIFCENEDIGELKSSLASVMDCPKEELSIEKEGNSYVISAPVKAILAVPSFWGIESEANCGRYRWERIVEDE